MRGSEPTLLFFHPFFGPGIDMSWIDRWRRVTPHGCDQGSPVWAASSGLECIASVLVRLCKLASLLSTTARQELPSPRKLRMPATLQTACNFFSIRGTGSEDAWTASQAMPSGWVGCIGAAVDPQGLSGVWGEVGERRPRRRVGEHGDPSLLKCGRCPSAHVWRSRDPQIEVTWCQVEGISVPLWEHEHEQRARPGVNGNSKPAADALAEPRSCSLSSFWCKTNHEIGGRTYK